MKNKKEPPEFIKQLEKCMKLYEELMEALDEEQREKLSGLDLADFLSGEGAEEDIENSLRDKLKSLAESF